MQVDLSIYSPRWGHKDTYQVTMERDSLEIRMQARRAQATWVPDRDPTWTGETVASIMRNDSIWPPPAAVDSFFETVWLHWRDGDLDDAEASAALVDLADWINVITAGRP